ncbi:hypothetical protein [Pseudobdellovibrio exovorus]|uniref:Nucleotidyl transferase AbiEii/AbiGii toxin family protein n=1 Tax=Pseudobdellovibrio exovorus JSS TaxID=1184267 RepID=M4VBH7_9BACT|nr:hypothetical protein [Pseudobdellovibrio exovorus]AGH96752.1 hypothetical protein A11Q_2536 [Pseudobdellovibrio exovorus JSS]
MSLNLVTAEMIKVIAKALGELNENAVFVGGATVPFYVPEAYQHQVRPTEDIDVVMEILGRHANSINEDILRQKGFRNDTSQGAPVCRWIYNGFIVDIMSSNIATFGFTNRWYKEGIEKAIVVIDDPVQVKIFSLPYFIASKIEAFKGRGNSDYLGSSDMEDIITVLEVSPSRMLEDKRTDCSEELIEYLRNEFKRLLNTSAFLDALSGAVLNRQQIQETITALQLRMKNF